MTEYLTDDELEEIKHYWENNHNRHAAAVMADTLLKDVDRLIATVDSLRKDLRFAKIEEETFIGICQRQEEHNAKLKENIDQLHADYHVPSVTINELREENAKLQEQINLFLELIDINTPREALIQLQGEMAELKDIHQREISKKNGVIECLKEKNRKLEDENDRLTGVIKSWRFNKGWHLDKSWHW